MQPCAPGQPPYLPVGSRVGTSGQRVWQQTAGSASSQTWASGVAVRLGKWGSGPAALPKPLCSPGLAGPPRARLCSAPCCPAPSFIAAVLLGGQRRWLRPRLPKWGGGPRPGRSQAGSGGRWGSRRPVQQGAQRRRHGCQVRALMPQIGHSGHGVQPGARSWGSRARLSVGVHKTPCTPVVSQKRQPPSREESPVSQNGF